MARRSFERGFTLLELVLVLAIIGTVLAMAAPSLRGWSQGSRLRDAADGFVAITRLARTQAVATCQPHRICIDPATCQYHLLVQQGQEFVPVASSLGGPFDLPDAYRIELTAGPTAAGAAWGAATSPQSGGTCIDFSPTGRTQPARVRIISDQGEMIEIECASPAEMFEVLSPGGGGV